MAENVIRQDIIEIGFDANLKVLKEITEQLDDIKKAVNGTGETDGLDKVKKQANKANDSAKKFNNTLSKTASALGTVAKKAAGLTFKATAVGIGACATAIGALTTQSVQAYAEFEQLKGGVETIFGAKGAKSVEEYARNVGKCVDDVKAEYDKLKEVEKTVLGNASQAYKTAGLSSNEYLNTVTSFSSSLIQSLKGDTAKAAEMSDLAIVNMADNANKYGTDMGLIQNAYQGFAKQNYTMLDNLKLGYGGTKTEMERLIKDAAKLDKSIKSNDTSFGNIVKAIDAIQRSTGVSGITYKEYKELVESGAKTHEEAFALMGTTAKEANFTVTGSLNQLKGAWGNVLTAMGSGEDLDKTFNELIESAEIFGNNLFPVVERSLMGLGTLVEKIAPKLEKKLPSLIDSLLPPLIKASTSLLKGLIVALPNIVKILIAELPDIAKQLGEGVAEAFGVKEFVKPITKVVGIAGGALAAAFVGIKGFGAIKSITSLFSSAGGAAEGVGKGKGPLTKLANMKVTTVLKGLANLAIIIGGLTVLAAALMFVAPYMAKLSDFGSILKIVTVMGVLGLLGTAMALLAGTVGKIPVTTVALGLANMAIVLVGFGALAAVFAWLSPKIAAMGDIKSILKVAAIMTALGAVGAVLSIFAGIVGMIPIPVVLAGLANIGLVLGGITALIVAFGALTKIDGFTEFINTGGEVLVKICDILGNMVGSLVGGALEAISKSLPTIGENLAAFGENLKPLFSLFSGVDMAGVGAFFSALAGFIGAIAVDKIVSFFGGKTDFSGISTGLGDLAGDGTKQFFGMVAGIKEPAFTNASKLFTALDGISKLPNVGGLGQVFSGKNDFTGVATGLGQLTGDGVKNFFAMVAGMEQPAFDNAPKFFKALSGIGKAIPNTGGLAQLFTGENGFSELASGLAALASDGVLSFFNAVNNLDIENLNGLWDSLKTAGKLTSESIGKVLDDSIKDLVDKATKLPQQMGDGIKSSGGSLSEALVSIWTDAVKAIVSPVNKVISGANWILGEFGSDKKIASWQPYARGTSGHKGGNAIVNDGRGAELVQMPNGNTFIPRGRNVMLPNAPKGMKVLDAQRTARLFGKGAPTFRYAKGTGGVDVWSYLDDSKGLVNAVLNKFVSYGGIGGYARNMGKAMVSTIKSAMPAWVDKVIEETGAKTLADYVASGGVNQWRTTVARALKMEGLYSAANVNRTLYQMQTESGGNPYAINLWDSNAKKGIPSKGLMQVIDPTFRAYARRGFDKNIYDPLSNILASVRYATARYGSLENAYQGHGYSGGVGSISLPQYSPSGPITSTTTSATENNTYAPVFNLTISGASDEKALAAKVKRWIAESLDECFEGMARRNAHA